MPVLSLICRVIRCSTFQISEALIIACIAHRIDIKGMKTFVLVRRLINPSSLIATSVRIIKAFSSKGFITGYRSVGRRQSSSEVHADRGSIIVILPDLQKCVSNPNLHNSNVDGQKPAGFLEGGGFCWRVVLRLVMGVSVL